MTDVAAITQPLKIDPIRFCIFHGEQQSEELTSLEFRILALFESNKFQALAKDVIQQRIWGRAQSRDKTLNVHFTYLRKKLAPVGLTIRYQKSGTFILAPLDKFLDHPMMVDA